jgi:hypothetical protein
LELGESEVLGSGGWLVRRGVGLGFRVR